MSKNNKGGSSAPAAATAGVKGSGGDKKLTPAAAAAASDDWKPVGKKKLKLLFGGIARSAKARSVGNWEIKEWQRLPMALLQEYCKDKKLPRPVLSRGRVSKYNPTFKQEGEESEEEDEDEDEDEDSEGSGADEPAAESWEYKPYNPDAEQPPKRVRARVKLPDPKRAEKDMIVETHEAFYDPREADEMSALLMLFQLTPSLPHEKTMPSPFKERWLAMKTDKPPVHAASPFLTQAAKAQHAEAKRVGRLRVERAREARLQQALNRYASVAMSDPLRRFTEEVLSGLRSLRGHALSSTAAAGAFNPSALGAPRAAAFKAVQTRLQEQQWATADSRLGALYAVTHGDTAAVAAAGAGAGAGAAGAVAALVECAVDHLVLEVPEQRLPRAYDPRGQQLEVVTHQTPQSSFTAQQEGGSAGVITVADVAAAVGTGGRLSAAQQQQLRVHYETIAAAAGDGDGVYGSDADDDGEPSSGDDTENDADAEAGKQQSKRASQTQAQAQGGRHHGGGNPFKRFLPLRPSDLSASLSAELASKRKGDAGWQQMQRARAALPSMKERATVLAAIQAHQVMVLTGETGCGKSTQLPQMVLDDAIERGAGGKVLILCTQPRRISAVGLAERVAAERTEKCGDVVGYQVRMDNCTSARTRLIFATTGVLLRQLVAMAHDPVPLRGLTHLFIDEVHERSVEIDFLLLVLKKVLPRRPDLRVVLMSATVNATAFQAYFSTEGMMVSPKELLAAAAAAAGGTGGGKAGGDGDDTAADGDGGSGGKKDKKDKKDKDDKKDKKADKAGSGDADSKDKDKDKKEKKESKDKDKKAESAPVVAAAAAPADKKADKADKKDKKEKKDKKDGPAVGSAFDAFFGDDDDDNAAAAKPAAAAKSHVPIAVAKPAPAAPKAAPAAAATVAAAKPEAAPKAAAAVDNKRHSGGNGSRAPNSGAASGAGTWRPSEAFGPLPQRLSCPIVSVPGRTFPVTEHYLPEILAATGYRPGFRHKQTLPEAAYAAALARLDELEAATARAAKKDEAALAACPGKGAVAVVEDTRPPSYLAGLFPDGGGDDDAAAAPEEPAEDEAGAGAGAGADDDAGAATVTRYDVTRGASGPFFRSPREVASIAVRYRDDSSYGLDYALIEAAIWHVCRTFPLASDGSPGGALLVFLPGAGEITQMCDRLERAARAGGEESTGLSVPSPRELMILPLHGALPTAQQRRVFDRPPRGVRKIVLTTNIAETSITVDDCEYVIDTGRLKETQLDPVRRMGKLVDTWCSRANCNQRRGRAGRVRPGHVYRLFTPLRWESMAAHQLPEMHRVLLDNVCLLVKTLKLDKLAAAAPDAAADADKGKSRSSSSSSSGGSNSGPVSAKDRAALRAAYGSVTTVLFDCVEPPAPASVRASLSDLKRLTALTEREELTPLGELLARLPVQNTRIGKLLIFGAVLRCATPIAVIAALASEKSPFVAPADKREQADRARARFAVPLSDHLTLWRVFQAYVRAKKNGRRAAADFCRDNFLSLLTLQTVEKLAQQFLDALRDVGLLPRARRGAGSSGHSGGIQADLDALVNTVATVKATGLDGAVEVSTGAAAAAAAAPATVLPPWDANASDWRVLLATVCAGLYPNLVKIKAPPETYIKTAHGMIARPHDAKQLKFYLRTYDEEEQKDGGGRGHGRGGPQQQQKGGRPGAGAPSAAADDGFVLSDDEDAKADAAIEAVLGSAAGAEADADADAADASGTAAKSEKELEVERKAAIKAAKAEKHSAFLLRHQMAKMQQRVDAGGRVFIHPRSVNHRSNEYSCPWLVYLSFVQTSKPYIQDCSMASVYALLLFGGKVRLERGGELVTVDDWVRFRPAGGKVSVLVKQLREELDRVLRHLIRRPHDTALLESPVMEAITMLLKGGGY
jgi:HrpA-like RNA helicase